MQELIRLYAGKGLVGRPPCDATLMFRTLYLSLPYDLAERDTPRFVDKNIPARYLLDLAVDRLAPDHSTLSTFKNRLVASSTWAPLQRIHDALLLQAKGHGFQLGHVQIVDATHTRGDMNHQKDRKRQEKGKPPRVPDSRVVNKGTCDVVEADGTKAKQETRYRGYKPHTSVNAMAGLPTTAFPASGDSADNKAFPYLFSHDRSLELPTIIYAGDKAYDDTDIFEPTEQAGMHVGISLRRFRTSKADPNKQRWQQLKETPKYQAGKALRCRVEQPLARRRTTAALSSVGIWVCSSTGYNRT